MAELFTKGLFSWPLENRLMVPVEKPWSRASRHFPNKQNSL